MYDDRDEVIEPVRVFRVVGGVEEAKFEWEHHTVRELRVFVQRVAVLETLQMQRQYPWQLLDSHPAAARSSCILKANVSTSSALQVGVS